MELSAWARHAIGHVAANAGVGRVDPSWRVTVNFHPDRRAGSTSVLEVLARDGVYRSQFETGTSGGGLTAFRGGDRWRWEQRLFGGAYDEAPASERPKYGALNHRCRSVGAAPRFGAAYLRLTADVLERTTFCFPDSVFEPTAVATAYRFALLPLVDRFDAQPRSDADEASTGGLLDDYVEAHVHGPLRLATDVEALVLDPSFRGSAVHAAAADLGVPLEWHEGRVLPVRVLEQHPDFRGAETVAVGRRLAVAGALTAAILADALACGAADAAQVKKVWHCVARFGVPAGAPTAG